MLSCSSFKRDKSLLLAFLLFGNFDICFAKRGLPLAGNNMESQEPVIGHVHDGMFIGSKNNQLIFNEPSLPR